MKAIIVALALLLGAIVGAVNDVSLTISGDDVLPIRWPSAPEVHRSRPLGACVTLIEQPGNRLVGVYVPCITSKE